MNRITASEQLIIFSRYIGQQVVISGLLNDDEEIVGTLAGIKENALLVNIDSINRWIPLYDGIKLSQVKLLLKPLKKLTAAIIDTANSLPVQAFITNH
jgi:ribosome maturation factor RimP